MNSLKFNRFLSGMILSAGLIASGSSASVSAEATPGSVPQGYVDTNAEAWKPQAASGLNVYFRKYGFYQLSVDGAGSGAASHTLTVRKPQRRAKVVKAYLLAATYSSNQIANGDIALLGKKVNWMASETNGIPNDPDFFYSYLADVTSIVKKKIDKKKSAGDLTLTVEELVGGSYIDGEILVVVFENEKLPEKRTVALLFGGQQLAGDRFEITLKKPIDKTDKDSVAHMGLGISYSYQGTSQYSIVDVNSQRLTTSAGGQDDGSGSNGSLITVGGIGDDTNNPSNPNATPTSSRSDDELYNLKPFLKRTTKVIYVDTVNPSDDDNIFFAWFDLSAKGDINKDTDGDGLLDTWEKKGYDHDGDGKVDVPLHKMGANYKKKDIYICYAWMEKSASENKSHKPARSVLDAVKAAFADAPVSNPNGSTGIKIHYIKKGAVPHDDDLNPVWSQFDALMDPLVSEAERTICHRMLNAHGYSGGNSSGLSRGIGASDFIETLGIADTNPGTFKERAGTIMHELGHNLGLRHGNVDDENYKPNHLSVMSYAWQFDWLLKNGNAKLDYERFRLKDLDESDLNETRGLDAVGGDGPIANYAVRYYSGGNFFQKANNADKKVNWNNNGSSTDDHVSEDINDSGGLSVLRTKSSEWSKIVYDGGNVGPGAPRDKINRTLSQDSLDELSLDEYRELKRNMTSVR